MSKVIRLKPFNPRKGLKLRTYTYKGTAYKSEAGWYEVPDTIAAYLSTVHQEENNPESPPAFDVCATRADAMALETAEKRAEAMRAEAANPHRVHVVGSDGMTESTHASASRGTLSTSDLRSDPTPTLKGSVEDLESDDLAADVSREERRAAPRTTRLVDPADPDTAVEGEPAVAVAEDLPPGGAAAEPPAPPTAPVVVPGAPSSGRQRAPRARSTGK